jgi:solute carrier family 35 protein
MAGIGDLSFEWSGYSAAFISCALQTTYLLLVERSGSEKGELCELLFKATTCH